MILTGEITYVETYRVICIAIASFASMFIAQIWKVITNSIYEKRFAWRYFFTTGGMPSSHSSTMVTMVTTLGILQAYFQQGLGYDFAIALAFTLVVIYDAMGVRYEAGKHAQLLNEIMENEPKSIQQKIGYDPDKSNLKVLLGHKTREVAFGILLGIIVGIIASVIYIVTVGY